MSSEKENAASYEMSVRQIQKYLLAISRLDNDIPHTRENGVYDAHTANAVKLFQEKHMTGVSPELLGKVDLDTWEALRHLANRAEEAVASSEGIYPFSEPIKDGKLILGDRSSLVLILHIMLDTLSLGYDELSNAVVSDLYSEATKQHVAVIQRSAGLPETGEVDKATWNIIAKLYNSQIKNR